MTKCGLVFVLLLDLVAIGSGNRDNSIVLLGVKISRSSGSGFVRALAPSKFLFSEEASSCFFSMRLAIESLLK